MSCEKNYSMLATGNRNSMMHVWSYCQIQVFLAGYPMITTKQTGTIIGLALTWSTHERVQFFPGDRDNGSH